MNLIDYFALQTKTKDELQAAVTLSRSFIALRGPAAFDVTLSNFKERYPERCVYPWFDSLIEAVREHYQPEDETPAEKIGEKTNFTDPFEAYFATCLARLNGALVHEGNKLWTLVDFTDKELLEPHMQWLPLLIKRHDTLIRKHSKAPMRLARIHPLLKVDDQLAESLSDSYDAEDEKVMTFVQYVKWYCHSRDWIAKLETDPLMSRQLTDTVLLLRQAAMDTGTCQSSVMQLNNIHPQSQAKLNEIVAKIINQNT